jgi:hypothetical protein
VADCLNYGKKPLEFMTGLKIVMDTMVMGKLCWKKSFVDGVALYISLFSTSHLTSIHLYVFEDFARVTLTILIIQRSTRKEVGRQVLALHQECPFVVVFDVVVPCSATAGPLQSGLHW